MIATQAPASPQEGLTTRYTLSAGPRAPRPPRDGLERLERVLEKPVWTRADRDRLRRASDGLWEHQANRYGPCPADCRQCALIDRIESALTEWDRINHATSIPSTAQLRLAMRRPDIVARAKPAQVRLRSRESRRLEEVHAGVFPYKTAKVRLRHERAAEEADGALRRLRKALGRVQAIIRDGR